ncbi:YozQ family protein [Halobacillus sp. GSS1]|uniref:YozQ family protein n=1 Tax=Halobacillus sp. GSS1 TaxID=2815919 RepID=UPI001A8E0FB1|nr:YozQ family protein [Halobacillus sp. GSS1]MBN9655442.1 YozQ family protein [Halobacillus sp. GSS1]
MKKNQMKRNRNQNTDDFSSEGLSITQEQVSDTLTEGTYDAKIDEVDENGQLISHKGEGIKKGKKRD